MVAVSLAGFLALFGYEAARMHDGGDPALAQTKETSQKAASATQGSSSSEDQSQSSNPSNGSNDTYGGGTGDYYATPQSDPPSTGSS